jgi:hypothetical protein
MRLTEDEFNSVISSSLPHLEGPAVRSGVKAIDQLEEAFWKDADLPDNLSINFT